MSAGRLFRALSILWLLLRALAWPALAWADHGGPLRSAPMSPLVTALVAGGLAFVAVLLFALIWRLMTGRGRDAK